MKPHSCIKKINKLLAAQNARLVWSISLKKAPTRIFVATEKVDEKKRGNLSYLAATYCPFCGVNLEGGPSGFEAKKSARSGSAGKP